VLPGFACDPLENALAQGRVAGPGAQLLAEWYAVLLSETQDEIATNAEADAIAGGAEVLRLRRDEADERRAAVDLEVACGTTPLHRGGLQIEPSAQRRLDLGQGQIPGLGVLAGGSDRHGLDESQRQSPGHAELDEVFELVVVDPAHCDGVDLDRRETRAPGRGEDALLTRAGRQTLERYAAGGTVVFSADRAADILQVLRFTEERNIKPVIYGAIEGWMVADALAEAKVPVVLDPLRNLPGSFDTLGARLDNAALLHEAGVTVIFGAGDSHNARKLRQMAGNAASHGLAKNAALAALTINPARVFNVARSFGSLEEGKRADLVLWSGDPLQVTTVADQVIVAGRVDSMETRQTRLRDRYLPQTSGLPRAYIKP